MSKLFKASRIIMDDEAYILKAPASPKKVVNDELIIPKELPNIQDEAQSIINEARQNADEIIESANISAEAIISDAYDRAKGVLEKAKQDGFDEGYETGLNQGLNMYSPLIQEATNLREEYIKKKEQLVFSLEPQMIEIVLSVIDKVFDFRLDNDPELVEGLIRKAISKLTKSANVTIYVSEDDYYHAMSLKEVLILKSDKIETLEIVKDSNLDRGSCVMHTDQGIIDSSLNIQLEEIKRLFEELNVN